MKRHLVILASLTALAVPVLAAAEPRTVASPDAIATPAERESVDPSALTNLLEEKGVITPEERQELMHLNAPVIDEQTMHKYFDTDPYPSPYQNQGWRGGP